MRSHFLYIFTNAGSWCQVKSNHESSLPIGFCFLFCFLFLFYCCLKASTFVTVVSASDFGVRKKDLSCTLWKKKWIEGVLCSRLDSRGFPFFLQHYIHNNIVIRQHKESKTGVGVGCAYFKTVAKVDLKPSLSFTI